MLANQQPLDKKYRDHNLSGNYAEFRECHIEPEWLLVYCIDNGELELFFVSHRNTLRLVLIKIV